MNQRHSFILEACLGLGDKFEEGGGGGDYCARLNGLKVVRAERSIHKDYTKISGHCVDIKGRGCRGSSASLLQPLSSRLGTAPLENTKLKGNYI